eukprot:scaffold137380_cov31-Tisochrysis_lutea.AAC.1
MGRMVSRRCDTTCQEGKASGQDVPASSTIGQLPSCPHSLLQGNLIEGTRRGGLVNHSERQMGSSTQSIVAGPLRLSSAYPAHFISHFQPPGNQPTRLAR